MILYSLLSKTASSSGSPLYFPRLVQEGNKPLEGLKIGLYYEVRSGGVEIPRVSVLVV